MLMGALAAALLFCAGVVIFGGGGPEHPGFSRDGRMPPELRSALTAALDDRGAGLRFGKAIPVPTPHARLWMVDGGGITCIVQERGKALSCIASAVFAKKGLAIGVFDPPSRPDGRLSGFLVLGVAPEWAEKVRLKIEGTVREIPTRQNAYSYEADRPITVEGFERD
jgi:hypothetical protein